MTSSGDSVRSYRDAGDNTFPDDYGTRMPKAVRDVRPFPQFIRHIYFDQRRSTELLEHIASTDSGRAALSDLARLAQVAEYDSAGVQRQQDLRAMLSQLIDDAVDLEDEGVVDLHYPSGKRRRKSWSELHPDQVIAIRGKVTSAKDVQPSSLRVDVGSAVVRVYVERDHLLHLNQSYLSGLPVTVVGKVRSVPRKEMSTAVIATL